MAIQTINIGTTANDGTGDPLRTAFNKVNQNFSAVTTGLTLLGTWNASTNTPTLTDGAGTDGTYYVVSVAGSTTLGGISSWAVGDYIIRASGAWTKFTPSAQLLAGDGTAAAPSISFAADTDVGLFRPDTNVLAATTAGVERLQVNASGVLFVGNGETAVTANAGVISATGRPTSETDGVGANLTIRGGASTGAGAGGVLIFSTAAAGGTGTTVRTAAERMRVFSDGGIGVGSTAKPVGGGTGIVTDETALMGPYWIQKIFQTPADAGTYTITLDKFLNGYLDIFVSSAFSFTNRTGDARYRMRISGTTVDLVTVDSPRNTGGGSFTSGYTFAVTRVSNTIKIALGKPSGANYGISLSGMTYLPVAPTGFRIDSITTAFV